MIGTFRRLFESTVVAAGHAGEAGEREHGYHVATAALLVEMMRADSTVAPAERSAVLRALAAAFDDLTPEETRDLLARAEERADDATSLYEFTRIVNQRFDHEQKAHVVELLWRIAWADGELDKYEESLVRRIADLIHVPHSVFIRMKHRVQDGALRPAPNRTPEGDVAGQGFGAEPLARRTAGFRHPVDPC